MTSPEANTGSLRGQRLFVVGFIIFFIASALGVTIWGFQVTAKVRQQAQETDVAIRSVGWIMLAAAADLGEFPTEPEALKGVVSPETLPELFIGTDLPKDRREAMAGQEPLSLQEAMEVLTVIWPPDGSLPPVLRTDGRPSGLGTLTVVNGWLLEAARAMSSAAVTNGG